MRKRHHKFIVAVHLIFKKRNKILLSLRKNTGWEDGKFSVVAGHARGRETIIKAMVREAKEEVGLKLKPNDLEFVHVMHRNADDGERLDFFFQLKDYPVKPKNLEPEKCQRLKWFKINELPKNIVAYVKAAIKLINNGVVYSNFGWKT